ncbi:TPA: hypothetical protein NHJ38_003117 [Legionella pneumophila]|nr:hypothetical protein [Legionella pneumophila]HCE5577515.1 hypothetical protein [Legionella pneumophila]HCE5599029.1 hypothetical protein [Legionella pneumophila]
MLKNSAEKTGNNSRLNYNFEIRKGSISMSSIITKDMEDILSSLSSTEELYQFIINTPKSKDLKTIEVGDGKVYLIEINMKIMEENNNE